MGTTNFDSVAGAPFTINFHRESIGASQANTTIQAQVQLPFKAKVLKVAVACTAKAGTANPTVDVWSGGATILSTPVTLGLANWVYQVDPAVAALESSSNITVRAVTDATGSITNLDVMLTVTKDE
ncbi:MAG: hypothetical protein HY783_04645 [Chloroflexi bacterium]|nr:hypothetical protein [Chloroflexota bacterium]